MFITPLTPYTRLLAFLFFRAESADEAYNELRRRDMGYIYPAVDDLRKDYQAMLDSMPDEVEAWWRKFRTTKGGVKPVADASVEAWCDEHGILKFYQQIMLARIAPVDPGFMGAWDLHGLKGVRAGIEAMKLAQMPVGMIRANLAAFNTETDLAVLDNYFLHFFFELDMSKDDIWAWVKGLQAFSRDNPAFEAEAESKRVALTSPGDLFLVMRRLGVACKVEPAEMLIEMRTEMFGAFHDAMDRYDRKNMKDAEYDRMERGINMMKKCLDGVVSTMEIGAELGASEPRKHKRQEISFMSNRVLRSRAQLIAEGEEIADRKKLPKKSEDN